MCVCVCVHLCLMSGITPKAIMPFNNKRTLCQITKTWCTLIIKWACHNRSTSPVYVIDNEQ